MAIKYEQGVLVTPSLARQWLDKNADENRKPKVAKIPGMARDMQTGRWNSETGETLKFDEDGWLLDGQNRLLAVRMAGIPIKFDIAHGLKRSAMPTLDSGAARTAADALKISGATDRPRTAAIVRHAILWDAGIRLGRGGTLNPTKTEITARFNDEPGPFDAAARRAGDCKHRRLCAGASAGVAHYLLSRIDADFAQSFFDQFVSGANMSETSPVFALRERLRKAREERIMPPEQLALFVRAWNFWRKDETISSPRYLIVSRGELTNANFPIPK